MFIKQTQSEKHEVEEPDKIEVGLKKLGKTKLSECTAQEKHKIYFEQDRL
jgi:hypothetical protein